MLVIENTEESITDVKITEHIFLYDGWQIVCFLRHEMMFIFELEADV